MKVKIKIILLFLILFINKYIYIILNKYYFQFYKLNNLDINNQKNIKNIIKFKGLKYLKKCLNHSIIIN